MNRKFLVILLLFIVLGLISYLMLRRYTHPEFIKNQLIALTRDNIGLDLAVEGTIDLSLLPEGVVATRKLALGNTGTVPFEPLLALDSSRITVDSRALLSKQIAIKRAVISGLELNLNTDKQGISNWRHLLKLQAKDGEAVVNKIGNKELSGLAFSQADEINIENAHLIWQDQQAGSHFELRNLNIQAKNFAFGRSATLAVSANIGGRSVKFPGALKWQAAAVLDKDLEQLDLTGNHIELYGFKPNTSEERLTSTVSLPAIRINLKQPRLNIPSLELVHDEINLAARAVTFEGFTENPRLQAEVNLAEFNPVKTALDWGLAWPKVNKNQAWQKLALSFHVQANGGKATVSKIDGSLDDTRFTGATSFKTLSPYSIDFDLSADAINLDRYLSSASKPERKTTPAALLTFRLPSPPGQEVLGVTANGRLHADTVIVNGMTIRQADLNLLSGK